MEISPLLNLWESQIIPILISRKRERRKEKSLDLPNSKFTILTKLVPLALEASNHLVKTEVRPAGTSTRGRR